MASDRNSSKDDSDLDVGLTTGALRAILSGPSAPGGRAEEVARRLGDAIRVGLILDGERLPSETLLAGQLGVAVVTLRQVLTILRGEGLIATRRGRGAGTIVTAPADREADLSERLSRFGLAEIRDLGDERAAVFAAAAGLAAGRSLPADLTRLRSHIDRLRGAREPGELRRADSRFTVDVAVAAQSPRLASADLRLRAEVGDLLWFEPSREDRVRAVTLRTQLVQAIDEGDSRRARELATEIIDEDTTRLARRRVAADRSTRSTRAAPRLAVTDPRTHIAAVFESLDDLAAEFAEIVASSSGTVLRRKELRALRPCIERMLKANAGTAIGAGVIVEPGLLDDVPLWLEWLWHVHGEGVEVLRINLDPAAPDFYDYAREPWFQDARRTGERQIAGPYVDATCTGEYALTLSMPVFVNGGFVGVVAADLLAAVVERLVTPWLQQQTHRALVAPGGRVLASLDPGCPPGTLLLDPAELSELVPIATDGPVGQFSVLH